MDIVQLRNFVTTSELLHFARSAERLGITQSALSRSIQRLEKELGFRLFSRANKWDVQLTIAGEVYRKEALRLLHDLEHARQLALTAEHGDAGKLVIGTISSMLGQGAFIDAIAELRRKSPLAVLEIVDSTSGELLKLLEAHKVDLAFLRLSADFADDRLICRKLFMDKLMLVVPKDHRLAAAKRIRVADLAQENFILVPGEVSAVFRNYVLDFCRIRGSFNPRIVQEVSNNYTALRLVAAKCGITLVSSAYRGTFAEHVTYLELDDFQPELAMFALYPGNRPIPLADKFIREFRLKYDMRERSDVSGSGDPACPAGDLPEC